MVVLTSLCPRSSPGLPARFAVGIRILAFERIREVDLAVAFLQILLVNGFHFLDMFLESWHYAFRERYGAVIFSFSVTDDNLAVGKINILDAQAKTFHESQARTKKELSHEFWDASHFSDHCEGFCFGEDCGEAIWFFSADDVCGEFNLFEEDIAVEKKNGTEGLILCGCGDVSLGGKVGDEGLNFGGTHFGRVSLVVVEDVAPAPVKVGLFCTIGVVFGTNGVAELIEKFFGFVGRRRQFRHGLILPLQSKKRRAILFEVDCTSPAI